MQDDDGRLRSQVESARQGDPDAWEWLYRRMYPRLYSYARRRLASDAAAADAVSETMARALEKIDRFHWRGAGFEGWLFGICRNVVFETQRVTARTTSVDSLDHQRDPTLTGPETAAIRADDRATLIDAFSRLDADEQEILELRIVAELSAEATGDVIGKRAGAVRMAQSRALTRLQTFFRELSCD